MSQHPPFTPETARRASRKRHSRGPVPPEVKEKISQSQTNRHSEGRAEYPPLLVGWKICTMCGRRKHYDFSNLPDTFSSDFSPLKRTNADGSIVARAASRCKTCQAEIKAKRYELLTPEERRKKWKKNENQRSKDARREYSRLYDEKKRRAAGVKPRNFKDGRNRESLLLVEAAPIAAFLQQMTRPVTKGTGISHDHMGSQQLISIVELAKATGLNDKALGALRSGQKKSIELRFVDKILTHFDCQHLIPLWYEEGE